jgi:hypothetical protein
VPLHVPPEHDVLPLRETELPRGPLAVCVELQDPPEHEPEPLLLAVRPPDPVVLDERL